MTSPRIAEPCRQPERTLDEEPPGSRGQTPWQRLPHRPGERLALADQGLLHGVWPAGGRGAAQSARLHGEIAVQHGRRRYYHRHLHHQRRPGGADPRVPPSSSTTTRYWLAQFFPPQKLDRICEARHRHALGGHVRTEGRRRPGIPTLPPDRGAEYFPLLRPGPRWREGARVAVNNGNIASPATRAACSAVPGFPSPLSPLGG